MPPSCVSPFSEQVAKEALEDAATAIRTGNLYVCDAGTIAIYTPGISTTQGLLVQNLPHRLLPSGCTHPKALRSVAYAKVFNREIVRFLMDQGPGVMRHPPD